MDLHKQLRNFKRQLERTQAQLDALKLEHVGNEENFTYHGGHRMGYLVARVSCLEDTVEFIELVIAEQEI